MVVVPDQVLRSIVKDGQPDSRHGISLTARPPANVQLALENIQQTLYDCVDTPIADTSLWRTPRDQLHATIAEVSHSQTALETQRLVDQLSNDRRLRQMLDLCHTTECPVTVDSIEVTGTAIVAHLIPDNEATLLELRHKLRALCPASANRYPLRATAHVTLVRFVDNVSESALARLQTVVATMRPGVQWNLSEKTEMRHGLTWYGGGAIAE